MTDPYDPLVSRDVTTRREQQRNLKTSQQKEMEFRQVNRDENSFHQSVAATNDHYMRDALSKVRESKVTLPDELTQIHGTDTTTNK